MATPLHKMILPYNRYRQEAFPFKYPTRTPIRAIKLPFPWLKRREDRELTCIKGRVSSKNDSYMVSELEREKEKEDNEEIIIGKEGRSKLADSWLEIHGADNWEGMLDPLDPLLRSELIRYGEMAQACYDAFDSETFSKYCGSCKFTPAKFFECLGLMQHGYEVTSYLYASGNINLPDLFQRSVCPEAWSQTANWIGYVAVSNDKMPISLKKIPCPDPRVRVESGFLDLYTNKNKSCQFCKNSAREQILAEAKRLIQQYKDENLSITITGHSLGSALAILSAYDIAETGIDVMDSGKIVPTCVFSFSGPRVGNIRFKEAA
ncbi:hypothetical protein Patl1_25242 [Pistacia atlantica]|uniref:Uncharacterized protein n=1 Tax=Pistacia atlantica TaxID=434234 RepID=A0ACC1B1H9_9ROSI|nr:hypothetical protein Patl1_25242 [Pistacia atlantica]